MSGRGFESVGTGTVLVSCLLAACLVGGIGPVVAPLISNIHIGPRGNIVAMEPLDAYFDNNRTIHADNYDWGIFEHVGDTKTLVVYIYNRGPFDLLLHMTYGEWTPADLGQYMQLSWDAENRTLQKYQETGVNIQLYHNATYYNNTAFNFNIVISGDEV